MVEWAVFREELKQNEEVKCFDKNRSNRTSTQNMAKENTSVSRVNGKPSSSSVWKTSGACHRAGPTTFVVVNVVVLNTGTRPKSTRRAFLSSSTRTLHYRWWSMPGAGKKMSTHTARMSAWIMEGDCSCRYLSPSAAPWIWHLWINIKKYAIWSTVKIYQFQNIRVFFPFDKIERVSIWIVGQYNGSWVRGIIAEA